MTKKYFKNYLSSGFAFTKKESELKLKYQFFNILLALNLFVVTTAAFIRFFRGENTQGIFDISYSLVGLLIILFARKKQAYFNTLVHIIMLFSLVIVSVTYINNTNAYIGLSWFFVQIMVVLFLSEKKFAYFMFFLSIVIILTTQYTKMNSSDFGLAAFGLLPFLIFSTFITVYERRNKLQKEMLSEQNALLEKYTFEIKHYDSLTDLPNRQLFMKNLGKKTFSKEQKSFSIIKIDIDNFKNINDNYGYRFADKIVLELSKRLETIVTQEESLSKSGPDEFLIMLNTNDVKSINKLNNEIMNSVNAVFIVDGERVFITLSIGIVRYPEDATNSEVLIQHLDSALHLAKNSGKHCAKFYDPTLTHELNEKMSLLVQLKDAIANNDFEVYFQPQVDANNDKIVGMEALVRWIHPKIGLIGPDRFIPLAEEHDLIQEIDFFVMKRAMRLFAEWKGAYPNIGRLSLNLSIKLLESKAYMPYLRENLQTFNFDTSWLELEITESQIMDNPVKSIAILEDIKNLGINISIDDFGTGYSSLAYLQKLPVNKLKIDRSFVIDTPNNKSSNNLVNLIIGLSNSLNLSVIAEGIERQEQKEFLLSCGCSYIQGYFYAKPLNNVDMSAFIKSH